MEFYLAQVFGALAWILLFISYYKNGNNKLLYLQILSCVFFALNYGFLGAYTGICVVLFEMVRDYLYVKVKDPMKVFYISLVLYTLIAIFSYDGFLSLFSVLASLSDAYALTKKNRKVIILGIVTYSLWLVYDINYASYSTLVAETLLIISNIIILMRYKYAYLKSESLVFSRGMSINTKLVDEFSKLDSSNFDEEYNWSKEKFNAVVKNKKTDIIYIHDEDDIIGYIHFIKINENKFNKMINQKEYTDVHRDEMKKFIKKKSNYLNINSISIRLTYQNKKTVALVSKFIKEYVVRKNRIGYSIKGIVGVANSEFENAVYKSMKMKCDTEEPNDFYVYYLKDDKLKEYLG